MKSLYPSLFLFLFIDTRETGFVNAITAAGVTYAVTRACTMGEHIDCSCDKNMKRVRKKHIDKNKNNNMPEGKWEWGGCGDNINFGFRKAKDFMDTRYRRRSDMKTLVKLHNYAAGRLVSKI